jgi:hypothetical protein
VAQLKSCPFKVNAVVQLDAGLLTRGQYSEGPATNHLDTGFSWFPRVFNILRTEDENSRLWRFFFTTVKDR